ncbi:hypothetical protein MMC17_006040, partial [Xylographa soralifera]|nr:hypothetical protein [Xylographa soralifera]
MADPLSISVSVLAVLGAVQRVVSVCKSYSSAINNASWALPRVVAEARVLHDVLEDLEDLEPLASEVEAGSVDQTASSHSSLCSLESPLSMCLAELQALEKDLLPRNWKIFDGPKMRAALQSMTWPLKETDTRRRLNDLQRLRGILSLALDKEQA